MVFHDNLFYFNLIMATLRQDWDRKKHYSRSGCYRRPRLQQRPQVKGIITKISMMSPKKPNSAIRIVAKVRLTSGLKITGRMPGIGYLGSKFNRVLVRGGRANDLPGVGYTLIRGVYDFTPVIFKKRRRSIYGVSRPDGYTKYVKKSLRLTL